MPRTTTHMHLVASFANLVDHRPAAQLEHPVLEADEAAREELAHRAADGVEVTLLWCRCHETVAVQVADHGANTLFELVVAREHALDAFYHPFAYAAQQGLDYEFPGQLAA